jgi:hypothetical protein
MEIGTTMLIGIFCLIGGIYLIIALTGKTKTPTANRPLMGIAAAGLLVIGAFTTGLIGADTTTDDTTETVSVVYTPPTTTYTEPTFEITPSAVTTAGTYNAFTSLNSAETQFTVPAWANTTGHTILEIDNTTWLDPRVQFIIMPIPPSGSDADQLATLWFDVANYDATIDADTAVSQRLITKTSGQYQVIWSEGSNQWFIDGSKTLLMTGNATLTCDFDVNQAGMSYMETNDPIALTITFRNNDWTWSKSYTCNFVVQQNFVMVPP